MCRRFRIGKYFLFFYIKTFPGKKKLIEKVFLRIQPIFHSKKKLNFFVPNIQYMGSALYRTFYSCALVTLSSCTEYFTTMLWLYQQYVIV